jgi:mycoredoxin
MDEKIILYGHPTCPSVGPIRGLMARSRVEYEYVNIRQDIEAAEIVRGINNGFESVPTLVFPDGSTLTEPSTSELKAKLESLGYKIGPLAWLIGNFWVILFLAAGLLALLRMTGVI